GKYRYELEQKAKLARKHQTQINVKEIKLRPKIGIHDYNTKKSHVERFLNQRAKVKVTIMFRGRETTHPERGRDLLMRLAEDVKEIGLIESPPLLDGRNMVMVLGPTKTAGAPAPGGANAKEEDEHRSEEAVLAEAKGYCGLKSKTYKRAKEQVEHSLVYAYRDRKNRKRDFRRLWIIRINAAARKEGLSYNQFVAGCRKANIELDRKVLADLAVVDPAAFAKIAEQAKAALAEAK